MIYSRGLQKQSQPLPNPSQVPVSIFSGGQQRTSPRHPSPFFNCLPQSLIHLSPSCHTRPQHDTLAAASAVLSPTPPIAPPDLSVNT